MPDYRSMDQQEAMSLVIRFLVGPRILYQRILVHAITRAALLDNMVDSRDHYFHVSHRLTSVTKAVLTILNKHLRVLRRREVAQPLHGGVLGARDLVGRRLRHCGRVGPIVFLERCVSLGR